MSILFICTFLPLLVLLLVSEGVAHLMGVQGARVQYEAAQAHYQSLLSSIFLGSASESLVSALKAQEGILTELQQELLPFFGIQTLLGIITSIFGLLGMLALLIGFFGTFKPARVLLRDARARFGSFFVSVLALLLVLVLGGLLLFFGTVLVLALSQILSFGNPGILPFGSLVGIVGMIGLCFLGGYWLLGVSFTLYEVVARKTTGFAAIRAVWARMRGKRWNVFGYSLLLALTIFVCALPFFLLRLTFSFGTYAFLGEGIELLLSFAYIFIVIPLLYFFYGFLYKQL